MVSIIIPIYNSEKYLAKCLNSVKNQSYEDFEVLLIDDGSTDNSAMICKEFINNDSRFVYYYKKNEGVSVARNFGINISKGKYIIFIDSDDVIAKDFLLDMIEETEKYNTFVCSDVIFFKDNEIDHIKKNKKEKKIKEFNNEKKYQILYTSSGGYIFNKLYSSKIIKNNKIYFDKKIYMCEDLLFNIMYLRNCNKVTFLNKKNYYYRQYDSNSKDLKNKKWFTIFNSLNKIFYDFDKFDYKSKRRFIILCKDSFIESKIRRYVNNRLNEFSEEIELKRKVKKYIYYFNIKLLLKKLFYCCPAIALKIKKMKEIM